MSQTCDICAESFNKSTRKPIKCFRCHDQPGTPNMCLSCVQTYLIQTSRPAHCMHCRVAWDRLFLSSIMTKEFMKTTFRNHRETLLETEQRSLLPMTMPILEQEETLENIRKEQKSIQEKVRLWTQRLTRVEQRQYQEWRNLNQMKHRLSRGLPAVNQNNHNNPDENPPTNNQEEEQSKNGFSRPCAFPECRGFLQPRTGHCLVCKHRTCFKCNIVYSVPPLDESKGENAVEHVCQESDILQWKEIAKTTKACPGCHTRIFKISGCHQMWCPMCHTAFNWLTGQVERGPIHNPHYYEWMFSNQEGDTGLAPRFRGCGQNGDNDAPLLIPLREFRSAFYRKEKELNVEEKELRSEGKMMYFHTPGESMEKCLLKVHQLLNHLQHDSIPSYRRRIEGTGSLASRNVETRICFLKKELTEEEFRRRLQRDEKCIAKITEYVQYLQTFVTVQSELLRRFCNTKSFTFQQWCSEYQQITQITNKAIENMNSTFQSRLSKMKDLQIYCPPPQQPPSSLTSTLST